MEQSLSSSSAAQANIVDVAGTDLIFQAVPVTDRTPTARQLLAAMNLSPHNEYVVLQWLPGGDIEEVRAEELIDMSDATTPKLIVVRSDRTYRLVLNDRSLEWPHPKISGEALRTLGGIGTNMQIFLTHEDGPDSVIEPDGMVNLGADGVETLYTRSKGWKLNVQGVVIESDVPEIRVSDAIIRAGFSVETKWIIILKTASQKKQVELDYVIDLRELGIEKLRLTPREINNGEVSADLRRDFALLPADCAWLDDRGFNWTTKLENGRRWLILRSVVLPVGYNLSVAAIAMEVPTAYPMAEIDMFYCFPPLVRVDGLPIPQTQAHETIDGNVYQRWSRHRGPIAPWIPGKDSVATHFLLIEESLNREVEK